MTWFNLVYGYEVRFARTSSEALQDLYYDFANRLPTNMVDVTKKLSILGLIALERHGLSPGLVDHFHRAD